MEEETKELEVFLKFATDPKGVLLPALLCEPKNQLMEELECLDSMMHVLPRPKLFI